MVVDLLDYFWEPLAVRDVPSHGTEHPKFTVVPRHVVAVVREIVDEPKYRCKLEQDINVWNRQGTCCDHLNILNQDLVDGRVCIW